VFFLKPREERPGIDGVGGEALVGLFNRLAILPSKDDSLAIQILGTRDGVGVSTIARKLARFAATNLEAPVLLVDANPHDPDQARGLGVEIPVSLEAAYQSGAEPGAAIVETAIPGLSLAKISTVLTAGDAAWSIPVPTIEAMLSDLRGRFRWVVFDSSPPANLAFSYVLSRFVEGTVLTVEAEKTRFPVAKELLHQIRANGGNPVGIVINKRRFIIPKYIYRHL
jgi:Mrp family chromosome partitioning ATPase